MSVWTSPMVAATRAVRIPTTMTTSIAMGARLKTGEQRTLEVVGACSDAYGADLITLDESESNTP